MKKTLLMLVTLMVWGNLSAFQSTKIAVKGTVWSQEDGEALPGCVIKNLEGNEATVTDAFGKFTILLSAGTQNLLFSYIGFNSTSQEIRVPFDGEMEVYLSQEGIEMKGVEVFSTGYQELTRERATGSFAQVNNELVNRRISKDILSRLEDVVPGLVYNRNRVGRTNDISIRGQNTIFANTAPLIIVDNFPYDGDINNINPNDVESVTVLRDAAAASIWGARAGNGVIVITTKKGIESRVPVVSMTSNATFLQRPDPFYEQKMGTGDFLTVEKLLFERNFYANAENSVAKAPLTPAVELMIAERDGRISAEEANVRLNQLAAFDVRNDFRDHYYRKGVNQQHAINVRGGSEMYKYALAAGMDRNQESLVGNHNSRFTLNAVNSFSLVDNKLKAQIGMYYVQSTTASPNQGPESVLFNTANPLYPYARLADGLGNPLPITSGYRDSFKREAETLGLLNWDYYPLEEMTLNSQNQRLNDIRLNANLSYKLMDGLDVEVQYQYWAAVENIENLQSQESYSVRNMINIYTSQENGMLTRAIPLGGIMSKRSGISDSHSLRTQLRYNKVMGIHRIDLFGGAEMKTLKSESNNFRTYGYNDNLAIGLPVDYTSFFPLFHNPAQRSRIPYSEGFRFIQDRFLSAYANVAYSIKDTYVLSGSIRKDASNIFGVDTNQKGVPLWSSGLSWIISNESFFKNNWLPFLRLKSTYGVNGNVDRSLSSLTTVRVLSGGFNSISGLPFGQIVNPPNPSLRWEKISVLNLGLDFESKNQILFGNIEIYKKQGLDLIGDTPFPPSSGITNFRGNYASTQTNGMDLSLSSTPINRKFKWNINLIGSWVKEKITDYEIEPLPTQLIRNASGAANVSPVPLKGRPLFAIYSYPWAGLDPDTGNPIGFLDGEPSQNYLQMINGAKMEDLNYHGPSRPTKFGALRNSFSWNGFTMSVVLNYRLGYFYRRSTVNYNEILNGRRSHSDFALRWQNPGDESMTEVPSIPASPNLNRDNFHQFTENLVEKGDHVRIQDVRLSYNLDRSRFPGLPFQNAELFGYANNLGILWKASDDPLDPDFRTMMPLRSIAFGLRVDF